MFYCALSEVGERPWAKKALQRLPKFPKCWDPRRQLLKPTLIVVDFGADVFDNQGSNENPQDERSGLAGKKNVSFDFTGLTQSLVRISLVSSIGVIHI